MRSRNLRDEATHLRKRGKTYGDIHKLLDRKIPKSTLNYWFKNLKLSESQRILLEKRVNSKIKKARFIAVKVNKIRRQNYLASIEKRIQHLGILIQNTDVAKIAVAMLYFGEGGKNRHGALMFGNSDPRMISLFLRLLRNCYQIDESKFRCTLQCRADQNIKRLEKYWLSITKIPKKQLSNCFVLMDNESDRVRR